MAEVKWITSLGEMDIPGVFILEETPPGAIQGTGTGVVGCAGEFERGPAGEIVTVGSYEDLKENFGARPATYKGARALANKRFAALRILRIVASDARDTYADFEESGTAVMRIRSNSKGRWGNDIRITIGAATSGTTGKFKVTISFASGSTYAGETEVWDELDIRSDSDNLPGAGVSRFCTFTKLASPIVDPDTVTDKPLGISHEGSTAAIATAAATDQATAITLANAIKASYNTHIADDTAHQQEDTINATAAANASDLASLQTLVNELKTDFNAHRSQADVHQADDEQHQITSANASDLGTAITLVNELKADINAHYLYLDGDDGTVADADYTDAATGIPLFSGTEPGATQTNILFAAEQSSAAVYGAIESWVGEERGVGIINGALANDKSAAVADVASYRSDRIIYPYPWLKTSINGAQTVVAPASFYAAVLSRLDPEVSPAAVEATDGMLAGITGYESATIAAAMTRANMQELIAAGIDPIEYDPDIGYSILAGISTTLNTSLLKVARRRMTDYVLRSIAARLKYHKSAVLTDERKRRISTEIVDFLGTLRDTDGRIEEFAVDSESGNTDVTLAAGRYVVMLQVKLFPWGDYILLRGEVGQGVVIAEEVE